VNETYWNILKKAGETFIRLGIRSVTLDDLCRDIGISKKTLYAHFEDKNALVIAVVDAHVHQMEAQANMVFGDDTINPMQQFIQFIDCMAPEMRAMHPALIHDMQKYHNDAWQILEKHKATFVADAIKNNIQRGLEMGYYRSNLNVDLVTRFYLELLNIVVFGKMFPEHHFPIHTLYEEFISYHLHGIASEKGLAFLQTNWKKSDQ
jgi:AcrR family transcriptional regulator